jgi:hypothetical protein
MLLKWAGKCIRIGIARGRKQNSGVLAQGLLRRM